MLFARNAAYNIIETVLCDSVGPATFKPRDGDGLCVVNPMNQVKQYTEVSSPYTEIGELEDRQGRETAQEAMANEIDLFDVAGVYVPTTVSKQASMRKCQYC